MVKICELQAHFFFENQHFSPNIREIEAHSFENCQFSMKICKICGIVKIGEIEAHFFFENSPFCVHFVHPDASGRVRFSASGFLNGAKASHHSLRVVRWWWLARSASALFRMRSKNRIGDRPTRPTDTTRHGTPHSLFEI